MKIEIFTDGACSGNPGRGGYGILMRVPDKNYQKTFSGGYRKTTNNRMELLAVIIALEQLKDAGHEILIFTDSKYVADAINKKWLFGWAKKGFVKIKNPDLWQRFYTLYKVYEPKFIWVKGHNGHPENELCDMLATSAAKTAAETDFFFENPAGENLFK